MDKRLEFAALNPIYRLVVSTQIEVVICMVVIKTHTPAREG